MENIHSATSQHHELEFSTKPRWGTFWILVGITLVELTLATIHLKTEFPPKLVLNGIYMILTLAKAFYIIAEFMHLRHEIKNLIMTIAVPAMLFIWFIIAFLWDSNSYKNLRNRYDPYHLEQSKTPAPHQAEEGPAAKKPGSAE